LFAAKNYEIDNERVHQIGELDGHPDSDGIFNFDELVLPPN
jgi:hypothetical protein